MTIVMSIHKNLEETDLQGYDSTHYFVQVLDSERGERRIDFTIFLFFS